jgi:hypothetical protein
LVGLGKQNINGDNVQKISWTRPGWCYLCKNDSESMDHLFVHCSFTKVVWKEMFQHFNIHNHWDKLTLLNVLNPGLLIEMYVLLRLFHVMLFGEYGSKIG